MYPSRNSSNPFECLFKTVFLCEQNRTSKQDDDQPHHFLVDFPSPFFHESELPLNQMLLDQNEHTGRGGGFLTHPAASTPVSAAKETAKNGILAVRSEVKQSAAEQITEEVSKGGATARARSSGKGKRRSGKKDRHSKIRTAQGVRDRRMRLSLQVAREFFDLQDLLGFDKASKTVEWLFAKSKKAIKELEKDHPHSKKTSTSQAESSSFISECEVVSGIKEINSSNDQLILKSISVLGKKEKGQRKRLRKTANRADTSRRSREEARARARSRTREKMMNKRVEILHFCQPTNPNPIKIPIGGVAKSHFEHEESIHSSHDVGTIESLLGLSSNCPISDYNQCSSTVSSCIGYTGRDFSGHIGYWDLPKEHKSSCTTASNRLDPLEGNPNSISLVFANAIPFHQ